MPDVSFRISSALKTIIGKELITDDFIAVFELVKNSFDANAKRVDIHFENLYSEDASNDARLLIKGSGDSPASDAPTTKHVDNARLLIKDNGDGMDEEDIKNKWLFVAYSSKRDQLDYRDKIKSERVFAGAKGIGRFSCDRLGAGLRLSTRKKGDKGNWHVLEVDWNKFEQDPEREFQKIKAHYSTSDEPPISGLQHGTVLEISELRSQWDRDKLKKLRRSLERLINPNQENDSDNFSIHLHAREELAEDKQQGKEKPDEPWERVNGQVRNFLFEALDLKTTQIHVEIDREGKLVLTRLSDRGNQIYEIMEHNPFPDVLHHVTINLFFLNRAAKLAFTRRMGLPPVNYGSVFLYKNGFRIHPFGDAGEDSLEIDRRKQQGIFRFLGTRDLSGRIEINGVNPEFKETSSRDGGLIKNRAFDALKGLFFEFALKRLEAYVINLNRFGSLGDQPEITDPNESKLRQNTLDIIAKLTQSKEIVDFNYDPKILSLVKEASDDSLGALVRNIKRISAESNNTALNKDISKAEKRLVELVKAKEESEAGELRERERASEAEEQTRKAQHELEQVKDQSENLNTQNQFLVSALSRGNLDHVMANYHAIGINAQTIENSIANALDLLKKEEFPNVSKLRRQLNRISLVAKKIDAISKFATHANFRADLDDTVQDLVEFLREYLQIVYESKVDNTHITFEQPPGAHFVTRFARLSVSIVMDNLLSNANKHEATRINVSVIKCDGSQLVISVSDDGRGIAAKNIPQLFQIGFSTTDGSGLGLYHSKEIMQKLRGKIEFVSEARKGAEFLLTFNRTS